MLEGVVLSIQEEAARKKGKAPMEGEPDVVEELLERMGYNVELDHSGGEESEDDESWQQTKIWSQPPEVGAGSSALGGVLAISLLSPYLA